MIFHSHVKVYWRVPSDEDPLLRAAANHESPRGAEGHGWHGDGRSDGLGMAGEPGSAMSKIWARHGIFLGTFWDFLGFTGDFPGFEW